MPEQHHENQIAEVAVTDAALIVTLGDGRTVSAPIVLFPKLKRTTQTEREVWQLTAAGHGIHWPQIDEDLSIEGLLRGQRAPNA